MKIATFNINNVNRRLPNLLAWLREAKPEVVCLQELKATDAEFPAPAIRDAGYGAVWQGQKSWNGVAILARDSDPVLTRRRLPGDPADSQSRYIEAAVEGVLIGCILSCSASAEGSVVWLVGFVLWPFVAVALQQRTGSFADAFLLIPVVMVLMAIGAWLLVPDYTGKDLDAIGV